MGEVLTNVNEVEGTGSWKVSFEAGWVESKYEEYQKRGKPNSEPWGLILAGWESFLVFQELLKDHQENHIFHAVQFVIH